MKELFSDKQIRLCDSIRDAKFKYMREFNQMPTILFLSSEILSIDSENLTSIRFVSLIKASVK